MATSFSGGRSRSTRREPPTMGKQLVNFITCGCKSNAPFFVIYKPQPQYCVMLGTNKGVQQTSALFSHGHNTAFLVPDSCRPTVRNGNYINVDVMDYIIGLHKKKVVSALFRQFGKCVVRFDIIGLKPCTYCRST
jgi:hypothetical protein